MIALGFDTSAPHCAAAVIRDGEILAEQRDPMARGQAERLMGLIAETLAAADIAWSQLNAIGVGTGPGNFTGIRISVAAARGLALGLGIPAIGITRFNVISAAFGSTGIACVPAPQDKLYISGATIEPQVSTLIAAEGLKRPLLFEPDGFNPAPYIARLAAERARSDMQHARPAPLYIKAADAAPARDAPPRIIA